MKRLALAVACACVPWAPQLAPAASGPPRKPASGSPVNLKQRIEGLSCKGVPLKGAIAALGKVGRCNLHVNWAPLGKGGVQPTTPVTCELSNVSLEAALETVLLSAGRSSRLAWRIERGVINVSTLDDLRSRMVTRVYRNVDRIIKPPGAGADMSAQIDVIKAVVPRQVLGGGSVRRQGRGVVVATAPDEAHRRIERLLAACQRGTNWKAFLGGVRKLQAVELADVAWRRVKLSDCLAQLSRQAGVGIVLDGHAFAGTKVTGESLVNVNLTKVTAEHALKIVLQDVTAGGQELVLDVIGGGEVVCVTTAAAAPVHVVAFDVTSAGLRNLRARDGKELISRLRASHTRGRGCELRMVGPKRFICAGSLKDVTFVGSAMRVPAFTARVKPVRAKPTVETPTPEPTKPPARSDRVKEADSRLSLAQAYAKAGLKQKAVAMFQQVVKEYPGTEAAKRAQAELVRLGAAKP